MDPAELHAWLRLQCTPGVGGVSARKLLRTFGLPSAVFAQPLHVLEGTVSASQAQALRSEPLELAALVGTTHAWLQAEPEARRVLTLGDACYPQALLDIDDPPLLLYAIAHATTWEQHLLGAVGHTCLAVVGSRNPSPQGAANAKQFSQALAAAGLTIVSGLALGVDGAAHEGALMGAPPGQVATIAVVGTGLDRVYPKEHRALAHRIALGGVLISEYALGTPPLASNFPQRNRIISGLSRGTLVVEAALQSGSLITARLAAEQGRDVFAIPGSIHSTQARGCHALIKQGAKLVESTQDILEELQWQSPLTPPTPQPRAPAQPQTPAAPDSMLVRALGAEPCGLDALQAHTGLDTPALQAELMALELAGHVTRLPGGLFQRLFAVPPAA
jgi:DNA processing protein